MGTSKNIDMAVDGARQGAGVDGNVFPVPDGRVRERAGRIAEGLRDQGSDAGDGDPSEAAPEGSVGPELPFAPRPYPRRDETVSPLRGCRVLVIDPDVQRGRRHSSLLSQRAAAARHHSGGEGLAELLDGRDTFDVVLVPSAEVDADDIEALQGVRGEPSVILIGETERAEAMGLTALPHDPTPGDLAVGVARALENRSLASENQALRAELDGRFSFGNIVTRDATLRGVLQVLESVAETRATVLILGETGTGKSLLARTLHQASDRRHGPYVEVNCGALPEGLLEAELFGHAKGSFTGATGDRPGRFEAAHGGTIFLDEIDSAPLDLQVKLLRVVQDRVFERVGESRTRSSDVRIIAATNASLTERVARAEFREDLYWRLRVVEVSIPPLRERPRDLAPLVETFLARFALEYGKAIDGITPEALGLLGRGDWPGNVRQLEHSLERAVLLSRGSGPGGAKRPLDVSDLEPTTLGGGALGSRDSHATSRALGDPGANPGPGLRPSPETHLQDGLDLLEELVGGAMSLKEALEGPEKLLIERALRRNGGRRDRAAVELEINRSTLFNKMRKYGLLNVNFTDSAS